MAFKRTQISNPSTARAPTGSGKRNDRIFGGAGVDHLIGGNGAEAFTQGQDLISLVNVDANEHVGGNQAFVLHSTAGAGRLVLRENITGYTVIEGYTDNGRVADFMLMIEDGTRLANRYDAQDVLL